MNFVTKVVDLYVGAETMANQELKRGTEALFFDRVLECLNLYDPGCVYGIPSVGGMAKVFRLAHTVQNLVSENTKKGAEMLSTEFYIRAKNNSVPNFDGVEARQAMINQAFDSEECYPRRLLCVNLVRPKGASERGFIHFPPRFNDLTVPIRRFHHTSTRYDVNRHRAIVIPTNLHEHFFTTSKRYIEDSKRESLIEHFEEDDVEVVSGLRGLTGGFVTFRFFGGLWNIIYNCKVRANLQVPEDPGQWPKLFEVDQGVMKRVAQRTSSIVKRDIWFLMKMTVRKQIEIGGAWAGLKKSIEFVLTQKNKYCIEENLFLDMMFPSEMPDLSKLTFQSLVRYFIKLGESYYSGDEDDIGDPINVWEHAQDRYTTEAESSYLLFECERAVEEDDEDDWILDFM
jgi:hypothetical protein